MAGLRVLTASTATMAAILLGAWAAVIPFVGPSFGFVAGDAQAWHLTTRVLVLQVIPGAAAFVAGLMALSGSRDAGPGRRSVLGMCSLIVMAAGGWLVAGPFVWEAVQGGVTAGAAEGGPLRRLAELAGYSWGAGALLAALGGVMFGIASVRHILIVRNAAPAPAEMEATGARQGWARREGGTVRDGERAREADRTEAAAG